MSIGDVGRVPLSAPIDLSGVQNTEIQQAAKQIKDAGSPLTIDQIQSALIYLKENDVSLTQSHVDNLVAGNPVISRPANFDSQTVINNIREQMDGNPWLRANPMATFTIIYLELANVLSQAKLEEGMIAADSVILMAQLAEEVADLIIAMGEAERDAYIVSAVMAIASAAIQIGGGVFAAKASSQATMGIRQMQVAGFAKLADAGDAISKAIHAMKKANLDALKSITENMLKTMERRLSGATEEYKANNDMISQVLQNLQKVIDEAYKAHGWQTK